MSQTKDIDRDIGINIRLRREHDAWTQEQLAAAASIGVRTVQRAEKGEHISAESLQAFAGAFDIQIDELRTGQEEEEPKLKDTASRYRLIRLERVERGSAFRNLMGTDALQVDHVDDIADEVQELAIAELEQDLRDWGDIWSDLEPLQRHDAFQSMQKHLDLLNDLGLIVAAGTDTMRLRSESIEKPFSMDVLHVLVSKSSEPKLFVLRDTKEQVRFT